MRIPRLAVNNYQFTLVVVLLGVVLGGISLLTMPRSEDPQVTLAMADVIAVYPGTTPQDMEKLVVDPIEEALNSLDDVKEIKTVIEDGLSLTHIEFHELEEAEDYYDDVVQAMAQVRDQLPADLLRLEALRISPSDVNIMMVALLSESAPYRDLKRIAERLETRLEASPGVKQADVWAIPDQQVQIRADLERMGHLGISLDNLLEAVQAAAVNVPGGHVDAGNRRFTVRTSGDFKSIEDIRSTTVKAIGDHIVFVGDIAEVEFADADPTHEARVDGKRAVLVSVAQRDGTNIFSVVEGVRETLGRFQDDLPEGVTSAVVFDQTGSVQKMVTVLTGNLLQGLGLVGIVVLLVLSIRQSLVVVLAIPVSMMIAIGWIDVAGYGLQQMTIAGLVIALGLLVDNAIVITENIGRLLAEGEKTQQAAIRGTSQMGWAVASGTATTLLAFVPMMMLQGPTGQFIRSLPVAVVFTLTASLLVALTFTPLLSSRFLRPPTARRFTLNPIPWLLERFIRYLYGPLLGLSLRFPLLLLALALAVFAYSLTFFGAVGVSLFPKAEKPQFMVDVRPPDGTSYDHTRRLALLAEERLLGLPEVASVTTNIGRGNPRVYYNIRPKRETPNYAQLFVQFHQQHQPQVATVVEQLREQLAGVPGVEFEVKEFTQGPPIDAAVAIWVVGDNIDTLKELSLQVEEAVRGEPGAVNVDNPTGNYKTDLLVDINRDKAGLLGIPLVTIDRSVRTSLVGTTVGNMRDELGDEYDILVRLADNDKPSLDDFDRVTVTGLGGATVPLRHVARMLPVPGQASFRHLNLERTTLVTADVARGYRVAEVTANIAARLDGVDWPPGYGYRIGGEEQQREESFAGITKALMIALLGIFAVLVLQFRSFLQPLIVFAAIPFAIIGVIFCLLLTGNTFSFMAFIGFSSLVGIVVNNSIILVDYANQLRSRGLSVQAAALESGKTRLVPILLTTLTTVGGLLPLTLSSSTLWAPLGWTIIGGLISSSVLTLYVVPVLYKLMTPESAKRSG
ncbi:efflux RND transporter permease subunit [Aestuariirhabdus litorea]|uniref:Efflux RND transporter permease subunit n=1 Tax=Aestuariirhabdus litorea TaxID=2528527 RepID=A0A3P3VJB5_9GAMM|nr:efflux RND transporter permease subunit [Aestuariirhabdus litorea]RRJ82454.1 efflux RND transporter permease subunit [Aestuariirhabdus litorea]RWW92616.1 efflux RND transporter permease subunit [Endozoicomonadaceae bacterium GTF-13]